MNRLRGETVEAGSLSGDDRRQMFALFDRCFLGATPAAFHRDLAEKHWVILLRDHGAGIVRGFSTQMLLRTKVGDEAPLALFSGDTIIDPGYWGDHELIHQWGRLAMSLIHAHPAERLYWFLITMGYKTYRFLPLFFREFYPRHDAEAPPEMTVALRAFANDKFAGSFDPVRGIVHFPDAPVRLRSGIADPDAHRQRNPDIRFFMTRNPGAAEGDELACIAPLHDDNLRPWAHRIINRERPKPWGEA
jgi:hypothetical protein